MAAGEAVNEKPDWLNIAEEIDALGKNQSRELASRLAVVLVHLIKLEASPATGPRTGWRETIRQQRDEIDRLLIDAPSLRGRVPALIAAEFARARPLPWPTMAKHRDMISIKSPFPTIRY